MKKLIAMFLIIVLMITLFTGCSEASRVSYNVSQQANNFNVTRRLAVINARSDEPIFELVGNFSIANNGANELEITVESSTGVYRSTLCI